MARHLTVWTIARPIGLLPGTSIRELADRYAETIRTHFTDPVDLVGVSTGGSIALQLVVDHPSVVKRLVLVSAASRLGDDGRAAQRAVAAHLRAGRPRRAAAAMLGSTTTRRMPRALRRVAGLALGRAIVGSRPSDLIGLLDAEDRFDATDDLAGVTTPTLIVGSGRDGYYSADVFSTTASRLPHGSLAYFARRGHLDLALDRAANATIIAFLHSGASS